MSFLKCICISVDSAHGSLQATARDKLVTVTLCVFVSIEIACVCVCVFCHWSSLLAADGRVSTEWVVRFGLTTVGGERRRGGGGGGVDGGSERWRDGGCLRNGGRRLRSNPINWGNCAERIPERGGGGGGGGVEDEFAKEREGVRREMWWLHFYY